MVHDTGNPEKGIKGSPTVSDFSRPRETKVGNPPKITMPPQQQVPRMPQGDMFRDTMIMQVLLTLLKEDRVITNSNLVDKTFDIVDKVMEKRSNGSQV